MAEILDLVKRLYPFPYSVTGKGNDDSLPLWLADNPFEVVAFESLADGRLYFPRLNTGVNGWIDWTWTASEVELFCRAFDAPYAGAGTFIGDEEVRLGGVHLEEGEGDLHPFTAGLVVRRRRRHIVRPSFRQDALAVPNSVIEIEKAEPCEIPRRGPDLAR